MVGYSGRAFACNMAVTFAGPAGRYAALALEACLMPGDRTEILAAAPGTVAIGLPTVHPKVGRRAADQGDDSMDHRAAEPLALRVTMGVATARDHLVAIMAGGG